MISQNISFKNFKLKNKNQKLKQKLTSILSEENEVINSLKKSYKNNYTKKLIKKFKNSKTLGSSVWVVLYLVQILFMNF